MPKTITIRNLSPETKAELKRRAAANGQSLQAYVLDFFIELANRPDPRVAAARAKAQSRQGITEVHSDESASNH